MKHLRLFLYAALGAVCLALWGAWQHDYSPAVTNNTVTTAAAATSEQQNTPSFGVSTVKETAAPSKKMIAPRSVPTASSPHRLVTVRTDILEVVIDAARGNIVSAKLLKYSLSKEAKEQPVQILNDAQDRFYTAQSGLVLPGSPDDENSQAQYVVTQQNYALAPGDDVLPVKLLWHGQGTTIAKEFVFKRGQYAIAVNYSIDNQSGNDLSGNLFVQIAHKNIVSEQRGLFHFNTFTGAAISSPEKPYEKLSYSALSKSNLDRLIQGGWLAVQQRYFLSAWIPDQNTTHHYYSNVHAQDIYTIGMYDDIKIPANTKTTFSNTFYVGPEIAANLAPLAKHLDLTIDYGWLWFLSVGLFWVMQKIYKIVGNWGWTIILVTLLIKLAFYKLSEQSYRSMARMRDLTPRLKALQERFKGDKQHLSQATMELYRKEKVNPLGGCLPILLQIPVFIALYYVLIEAVELRQAPFMFWIQDLAAKDPYYILPILMGISMFFQQRLSPQPADPMQAKMMMVMPIMFTVFFLAFPSGLVLYWLVNNVLSILQQWYITRTMNNAK